MRTDFIDAILYCYEADRILTLEVASGSYAAVVEDAGAVISHHLYESSGMWRLFSHSRFNGEWKHTASTLARNEVRQAIATTHEKLAYLHATHN